MIHESPATSALPDFPFERSLGTFRIPHIPASEHALLRRDFDWCDKELYGSSRHALKQPISSLWQRLEFDG